MVAMAVKASSRIRLDSSKVHLAGYSLVCIPNEAKMVDAQTLC